MPITNFPFLQTSPNSIQRPMLIIRITNPESGYSINTTGVIDTGADACAVPASFASILGLDLKTGRPKPVGTGNGLTTAFTHECRMDVYHTERLWQGDSEPIYSTNMEFDFMENLPVVLIGVGDFLCQFLLCIDYKAKLFSVRYI